MVESSPDTPVENQPANLQPENDVFISYSRRDKSFVEKLDISLRQAGRDPWVDWDDIRKGEDWWQAIQRGIEAADSFIFVISPASVLSPVCRDEIDYATQLNKRFLPILWQEGFEMPQVHRSICQHNWIFFRQTDNYDRAVQELVNALDTDLGYIRAHTRLLLRSLEWQHHQQDGSYLLRGRDLEDARQWLTQAIVKQPTPTQTQVTYINASLAAQTAALKARQKAKWVVVLTTVIANLVFISVGLGIIYLCMHEIAREQVEKTMLATLTGAISGVDGDRFAQLTQVPLPPGQTEPVNNPLYQEHQAWLATVHQIAPAALPATYVQAANGKIVTIGDVCRIVINKVDHPYRMIVPELEVIPARLAGFRQVSVNLTPYKDRLGKSWVSVYAPIRDRSGAVVGAMGLAYDSTYWTDLEDHIRLVMMVALVVALIWLTISSWVILQATRLPPDLSSRKH